RAVPPPRPAKRETRACPAGCWHVLPGEAAGRMTAGTGSAWEGVSRSALPPEVSHEHRTEVRRVHGPDPPGDLCDLSAAAGGRPALYPRGPALRHRVAAG